MPNKGNLKNSEIEMIYKDLLRRAVVLSCIQAYFGLNLIYPASFSNKLLFLKFKKVQPVFVCEGFMSYSQRDKICSTANL